MKILFWDIVIVEVEAEKQSQKIGCCDGDDVVAYQKERHYMPMLDRLLFLSVHSASPYPPPSDVSFLFVILPVVPSVVLAVILVIITGSLSVDLIQDDAEDGNPRVPHL